MKKRKQPAPRYTPDRASAMLAEAEYFGDRFACDKWDITSRCLYNYRAKLKTDKTLSDLFVLKKRILAIDWKSSTVKTLKITCERLNRLIPTANREDADLIHAIVGAAKIFGELNIASEALSDTPAYDPYSLESSEA